MRANSSLFSSLPRQQINKGFTLIEVLVAFIVLTVGLLGTVALQSSAKKASYDANQRSAALALANDIVERIRSNDSVNLVNQYDVDFNFQTALPNTNCMNAVCSSDQIAQYDILQWQKALRVADNTGALANGFVCITPTAEVTPAGVQPTSVDLQVVVAWQGRAQIEQSDDSSNVACGNLQNRRMVVVNSYIFVRA